MNRIIGASGKDHWNWKGGEEGLPHCLTCNKKLSLRKYKYCKKHYSIGEDRFGWKGDKVSYRVLHKWVQKNKGKAEFCLFPDEECSSTFQWANISHLYKRDLNDWMPLCVKHHKAYDSKRRKLN